MSSTVSVQYNITYCTVSRISVACEASNRTKSSKNNKEISATITSSAGYCCDFWKFWFFQLQNVMFLVVCDVFHHRFHVFHHRFHVFVMFFNVICDFVAKNKSLFVIFIHFHHKTLRFSMFSSHFHHRLWWWKWNPSIFGKFCSVFKWVLCCVLNAQLKSWINSNVFHSLFYSVLVVTS